jgi:DNA-binding NtrC family response regulator
MRAIDSVLVIDDSPAALELLGQLLSALGVNHVRQTGSAEEALEILKSRAFSLILSDYRLEGMDGVEFLERLRAQGNETPVLIMSGAPDKSGVIRATHQPKVDFFPKPFQMSDLMRAMEHLAEAA